MENKEKGISFLKGTISLSLAVIVTKVLGVMYKVPLSYILDDEGMGYFNSAYAIYSFFYILCTAGVPKAVTITLSERRGKRGDGLESGEIVSVLISLFLKISLAVCLFVILFAPALVNIIGNKKALHTIVAIAPSIVFVSISGVFRGYLNYEGQLTKMALSQFFEALVKLGLGLLLAFVGMWLDLPLCDISAMSVLGITVASFICCIYLAICTFSSIKKDKAGQRVIDRRMIIRDVLRIVVPISLGSSLLNLTNIIDLTLMMSGLERVGLDEAASGAVFGNYTTLAVPMVNLVISLITPITLAYLPALSTLHFSNSKQAFNSEVKRLVKLVMLISVPCFYVFLLYSFDTLDILFSADSAALGAQMLSALSVGVCLLSLLTVVNTALEAKGKITVTLISLFSGSVVKSIFSYILIRYTTFAELGAPLGTVISYFVSLLISVSALRRSGVVVGATDIALDFIKGGLCFIVPYEFIYSYGLISNPTVSLCVCCLISCLSYLLLQSGFVLSEIKKPGIQFAQNKGKHIGCLDEK